MASPSFASEPSGLVHQASLADRLIWPRAADRAGDDAACLRPLRVVPELFPARSMHICLGLEIDLPDRRRTANDAQADPRSLAT
jgi:hypothetical protein